VVCAVAFAPAFFAIVNGVWPVLVAIFAKRDRAFVRHPLLPITIMAAMMRIAWRRRSADHARQGFHLCNVIRVRRGFRLLEAKRRQSSKVGHAPVLSSGCGSVHWTPCRAYRHSWPLCVLDWPLQHLEIEPLSNPSRTASIAESQCFTTPVLKHLDRTALETGCSFDRFPRNGLVLPLLNDLLVFSETVTHSRFSARLSVLSPLM